MRMVPRVGDWEGFVLNPDGEKDVFIHIEERLPIGGGAHISVVIVWNFQCCYGPFCGWVRRCEPREAREYLYWLYFDLDYSREVVASLLCIRAGRGNLYVSRFVRG